MKRAVFLLALVILLFTSSSAHAQDFIITSYDINTKFSGKPAAVDVSLTCNFNVNNNLNGMQFIFGSECILRDASYINGGGRTEIPYKFDGKDSLMLTTGGNFLPGNDYSLKFNYSFPAGTFNDTILILDRGHRWYPLIMDQIVPYKLTSEVPNGFSVLSAGDLVETNRGSEKSVFVWESKMPVFKIPLIVINTNAFKKTSNDICDFFYLGIDSMQADGILNETGKILKYFENNLGAYPHKKLTLCEVKDFPGINTGSGLLTVGFQTLEYMAKGYTDMLILTIAQQWFGAGVFAKYGDKGFSFLNISLPNFLELMYIRSERGDDAYNDQLKNLREEYWKIKDGQYDLPVIDVDFPNTMEKGKILYAKGPLLLSRLEKELGRDNWLSLLKDIYNSFRGKILTYNNFIEFIAKYDDSGRAQKLMNRLMNNKGWTNE